jgi:hypothetical protein
VPRVGDALLAHCLNCIRLRRACQSIRIWPQVCLSAEPARVTHYPEVPLARQSLRCDKTRAATWGRLILFHQLHMVSTTRNCALPLIMRA